MKKDILRAVTAGAVVLVLYCLAAFLIPFEHTAAFWVSFVFTLAAFAVAAYGLYIAFVKNPDAKSRFYGFPIARIGMIYWITQLIVGIVFMALGVWVPAWTAALVCALLLGAALIGLISAEAVVEQIHEQDAKLKAGVSCMRALQSRVHPLVARCEGKEADALGKFAEELRYSDPVSSDATIQAEADLTAAVYQLEMAVTEGDKAAAEKLCCEAMALLAERNRLCKLNK